ncbi:unnamed protein product (macronuclear) [Paramecium tetraurelia]|uniref:Uncharacterized protein n=1 Tax=Paramecium tetraurelia TaxID=5888 RepID=A0DUS1_PARTE|nr:uncharacterized protein GSPATT00039776001 [Paramecium tetraurelia]CAK86788.1 unnamed protein product [Paramecium tetraurelia]|eukprot:XP_001454185.1 hypothetical protein (macronuclear) [Paramecium tetraurelia strain d4-2]
MDNLDIKTLLVGRFFQQRSDQSPISLRQIANLISKVIQIFKEQQSPTLIHLEFSDKSTNNNI